MEYIYKINFKKMFDKKHGIEGESRLYKFCKPFDPIHYIEIREFVDQFIDITFNDIEDVLNELGYQVERIIIDDVITIEI